MKRDRRVLNLAGIQWPLLAVSSQSRENLPESEEVLH